MQKRTLGKSNSQVLRSWNAWRRTAERLPSLSRPTIFVRSRVPHQRSRSKGPGIPKSWSEGQVYKWPYSECIIPREGRGVWESNPPGAAQSNPPNRFEDGETHRSPYTSS
jgi:hypothetical protein